MKNRVLPFLLFVFTCFISCTPNDDILSPTGGPLPAFTVTVTDRAANHAIITWTDADDPFTSDTVFYNVFIDSIKVNINLTRLNDTIRNLDPLESYNGRVVAFTKKGDTASAAFFIEKLDGMVVYGEMSDFLLCYSLYTEDRVWKSPSFHPDKVHGVPVIVGDTVFCAVSTSAPSAFSLKTGAKIWGPAPNTSSYSSIGDPVYENGTLYVRAGDGLAAVNSHNGTLKWKYSSGSSEFFLNPVIGKDFIISGRNVEIYAIRRDGSFGWKQNFPAQLNNNPCLYNNVIVVGCANGRVYGVSQTTGAILWNRNFSEPFNNYGTDYNDPIVFNNSVIIQSGNHGIFALNPNTGATIWQLADITGPHLSAFTIGKGILYCFNAIGDDLLAIDAATGTFKWSHYAQGGSYGSIIYANGLIYINHGPKVNVLDANTGEYIRQTGGSIPSSQRMVIVDQGKVYYPSSSGMLN